MKESVFWEYWIEDFEEDSGSVESRLNELGKLRWELVSVINLTNTPRSHELRCILKRTRSEPEPHYVKPF